MDRSYVIVRATDGEFISPFLMNKFLTHNIGKVEFAKNTKEGMLLKLTAKQITQLKGQNINGRELIVVNNDKMNQSNGVIFYPSFNYIEDTEILDELKEQGVIELTRFTKKSIATRNEKGISEGRANTGLYMLKFNKSSKPNDIIICFEKIRVNNYYPNPMKCKNCHRMNHTAKTCRCEKLCGRCGDLYHDVCQNNPKCINCNEDHSTWDRKCAVFLQEKEIIKYSVDNNVPFKEARQRQQTNIKHRTFADKLNEQTKSQQLEKQLEDLRELNKTLIQQIKNLQTNKQQPKDQPINAVLKQQQQPAQDHLNNLRASLQQQQEPESLHNSDVTMESDDNDIFGSSSIHVSDNDDFGTTKDTRKSNRNKDQSNGKNKKPKVTFNEQF